MANASRSLPIAPDAIPLERDLFLRNLLGHLATALQDVVGLGEAEGFVALVGQRVGEELNATYRAALGVREIPVDRLPDVLVDLKTRIKGGFSVESATADRIVFVNDRCPFEAKVVGRPSLCMMTSNVFGTIAAENVGQSRVILEETIAQGAPGCRVIVLLGDAAARESAGRAYYRLDT